MKNFACYFMLGFFLCINTSKEIFCQVDNKPPYPIIFVHGWAGSDLNWIDDGSWIPFLSEFGWSNGGVINICLESSKNTLHDPANIDISLIYANTTPGDYYFINFDVKITDGTSFLAYPDVAKVINPMNSNQDYFELTFGGSNSISNNDIVLIGSGTDQEIVRVTNADPQNNMYLIDRYEFGTTPTSHGLLCQIKVHSNLSNQASLVKGGKGIKIAIDHVKSITGKNKVILVCHSMGGINARKYVQSSDYQNDVALITTFSTPHLGSNKSDLEAIDPQYDDYDLQSDAVRDLRYSTVANFLNSEPPDPPYGDLPDNAVALFGGTENLFWPLPLDFYSYDYNGDGIEGSPGAPGGTPVDGLNRKSDGSNITWPSDVMLHCIIGRHYQGIYPVGSPQDNDVVVRIDRQFPHPNIIPENLIEIDTFKLYGIFPPYIAHFYTNHKFPDVLLGLDEPDSINLAYQIPALTVNNIYTTGFTTPQSESEDSDADYYKFIASTTGNAKVKIFDIPNVNNWELSIYNNLTGSSIATVTNIQQPGNIAELTFAATAGQSYYIGFTSNALPNNYDNPYKIQVSSQILISSVQFDQSSYSPETAATVTVTLGNLLTNVNVTVMCNSETYVCYEVGGGVYNTTFIVPSAIGNYPIIVNASKTGYINAAPFNTSLLVEELGASPYPPIISLTHPNNELCHDECYIIWNDTDPDNNAVIFLYYDNNSSGETGTCINPNNPIFEDNAGDSYIWNTVNMPEGIFWIYATIDDGTTLTSDYSPGYIEINHPDLNSDFSYSSKSADEDEGDGDGIIESGESFDLDIWIKNLSYITTYSDVDANLTTTNPNVTITDNDSYYGIVDSRETKKGDDDFDIQVDEGYEGNVSFQLNLTFEDESGYLFYQVLDIPSVHIYENVSPSFQIVDLQILDDGSKCNNDGIINSGENSIDYKLKLLNNGGGSAYDVDGTVLALPSGFNTPNTSASYPDIPLGSSKWPETNEDFNIYTVPNSYVGIIYAQLQVSWGDDGSFSQLIPFTLNVSPAVRLGYNPDTYDFGIEALGDTAIIPVMIRNYGTADLIISEIENLSLDTNNWITDITFPLTINPDDTVFLNINIKRDLQENVLDTFRIHSNNHTVTTHDIVISGTFFEPMPQGYVQEWSSNPDLNQGGEWVEVGNLDNDGLIDVVTFWREYLYVWEQTEVNSLEFELKFTHTFTGTEVYIESVRIGNCDGDNKTDIVIREYDDVPQTQRVWIFETSANDQYVQVWSQTLSGTTGSANCQEVGNCDTDTNDEILIYDNGRVYVYNSTGNNAYATTWNSGTTISSYGASISQMGFMTTGDTDQDGSKEIIFPGDDEYIFMWEKNASGSGYTLMHDPLVIFNPDPDGSDVYPIVFDIDYDNANEIVISGDGDGFEFSVFNPSNWTYEFHNSLGLYGDFTSPAISDLNGNVIAEVFMGENVPPYRMIVYEYINGSYFEIFASSNFGDDINNIRAFDLDNDGKQELLLAVDDHFRTWKYEIPPDLPDLHIAVNNISFSIPEPLENDTILISALIRNIGSADAENVPVEFFISDTIIENRIDSVTISNMISGGEIMISSDWVPTLEDTCSIYVLIDRNDLIVELDSTNNMSSKSIIVMDNDTIPPAFLSNSHIEYMSDGDGLIEDNESFRFDWQLYDESGIDSTYIYFDSAVINGLNEGGGYYYQIQQNKPSGTYPYEIYAFDNDNSQLISVIYDTLNIFQHAPHVTLNYPLNNAINISLNDSIVVEFDIPMQPTTINNNTFLLFKNGNILIDPLSINYLPNNRRAVLEPGVLEPSTVYEVYILSGSNGVKDLNNNALETTYSWLFTTMSEPFNANFSASPVISIPGMVVAFTDLSTGNPNSWYWSFGDEGISNEQNPLHEFYIPGIYNVRLIISDGIINDTVVKDNYINIQTIGDTSIWTGSIDRVWYKISNWSESILPHSNSTIYIPGSPLYQPILNNDATANKLILQSGSELIINAGKKLTIQDSLIIGQTLNSDSTKLIINGEVYINNGNGDNDTLASNLISYWKIDETSGTTVYDSHGSNNCTV